MNIRLGIALIARRRLPAPLLSALTLSDSSVPEDAPVGTVVGSLQNVTDGSTLALTGDAGGLFSLSGIDVEVAGALDYETATSHQITVRETFTGLANSPKDNVLTIQVTDVAEEGTAASLTSIASNGWTATWSGTPPTFTPDAGTASQHYVNVTRQGYDATGTATTYVDRHVVTQRVRQPYPNQASLTASDVALSEYVYSTDTIAGVTNNSAETSPKPVANWAMPARQVVGSSLVLEVVAFHRDGVACVEFSASDGTHTVTQKVSATVVSGRVGDRHAMLVYKATLDLSSLNDNALVTCNAKVYPRIGAAASIADSSGSSVKREFSPRYFYKSTTLAAAPFYAYVAKAADAPNGIGTPTSSGVVSTNLATAKATPFDTFTSAINGLEAVRGANGLDGCIIMVGNDGGTAHVLTSPTVAKTQKCGVLTLTRDPNVAKANARVSFGAASFGPRLGQSGTTLLSPLTEGAFQFRDIAVVRTGLLGIGGTAGVPLQIICDQVDWDNANNNATWLSQGHDYHFGTTFTNTSGSAAMAAATYEHRCWRGISVQPSGTTAVTIEPWLLVGSAIRSATLTRGGRSQSGSILAFNSVTEANGLAGLTIAGDEDVTNAAIVQNVVEWISATQNPWLRVSADSATGDDTHVIIHANSFAGAFNNGRWNTFYDEGTTRRTSKLMSVKGNIVDQINTKSDVFRGVSQAGADASSATGNWAFMYGVGCQANFAMYTDAGRTGLGGDFAQAYPGLGSSIPAATADDTTERSDPLFTDDNAVTSSTGGTVFTAGAGGGDYSLQAGSPCKGMVPARLLTHDLAGNARPATADAAGAYA